MLPDRSGGTGKARAMLATELRGGVNGGNAEKPAWTTRGRPRDQDGFHITHWCCQRQESRGGGLTWAGDEGRRFRPKEGKLEISSNLHGRIQIKGWLSSTEAQENRRSKKLGRGSTGYRLHQGPAGTAMAAETKQVKGAQATTGEAS